MREIDDTEARRRGLIVLLNATPDATLWPPNLVMENG
jgi:hypothetical protein